MNRNQATFPSLKRRGGCGINQISRSNRIAAEGVVSSAKAFRPNHFSGLTTPSARTKVAPRYFFDRASTPPFQGVSPTVLRQINNRKEQMTPIWDRGSVKKCARQW